MLDALMPLAAPPQAPLTGQVMPMLPQALQALMASENVTEDLPATDLAEIGGKVVREYEIDVESMAPWRKRMESGLALAALVKEEEKDYPWKGAANVRYPLVTNAALMFNAKAYPAVVPSDEIVKVRTWGADPQGLKQARGDRVSAHMSWQLSSQIEEWEEETDKLLTLLSIVGTIVRKTWFDPVYGRVRVRNILPGAFVVNARTVSLFDCPRCTEELSKYPSEIAEKIAAEEWRSDDYLEIAGEDSEAPEVFLEQHRRLDLDGDGYAEPYIVTVHKATRKVARIVADFEADDVKLKGDRVVSIRRGSYFVAYHFLPSLDGTFFGTGFGLLLGDISETINSIMNLLMDAGHMASLGGGFIGSDFRIKGGAQRFKPGEWKLVTATGGTVRESIVPFTVPGPDATLFQLLGVLIEAGKEVASIKDVLTGETKGAANMPATTTLALIEQGMAQFTAAYKRIFRSLKAEFRLIARINQRTVGQQDYSRFHDQVQQVPGPDGQPMMVPVSVDPRQDYDLSDMDITPVADPASVTRMQEAAKAQFLMEMVDKQLVDRGEASDRMLRAAAIPDREALKPKPDPVQQQMGQLQMKLLDAQGNEKNARADLSAAQAQVTQLQRQGEAQRAELERLKLMIEARSQEIEGRKNELDAQASERQDQMAQLQGAADMALKQEELRGKQQRNVMEGVAGALKVEQQKADLHATYAGIARDDMRVLTNPQG